MSTNVPLRIPDYHIAFTLKPSDAGHCDHCAEMARIRDGIHTHIRLLLEDHTEVDLTTTDLRYLTTVTEDPDGNLLTRDRYAEEEVEHYTDPTYRRKVYARI